MRAYARICSVAASSTSAVLKLLMGALDLLNERERQSYSLVPARERLRESFIEALTRFDGGVWLAGLKDDADPKVQGLDIREATPEDPRRVADTVSLAARRRTVRSSMEGGLVTTVSEVNAGCWGPRRPRIEVGSI